MPIERVTLHLHKTYMPEFEDANHRSISITGPLYELFKKSSSRLDFARWLDAFIADDRSSLQVEDHHLESLLSENPCIKDKLVEPQNVVKYLSPESLHYCEITFDRDGQAIYPNRGDELAINEYGLKKRKLSQAMVISLDGHIYANTLIPGSFHHSSFNRGGDLAFAAEAIFSSSSPGVFSIINDRSGHYRPNIKSIIYGLNVLSERGADLSIANLYINSWSEDESALRQYEDIPLFLEQYNKVCSTDTPTLEFTSVDEARTYFEFSDNSEANFYIKSNNDFFEFKRSRNGSIMIESFHKKYSDQIAALKSRINEERKIAAKVRASSGAGPGLSISCPLPSSYCDDKDDGFKITGAIQGSLFGRDSDDEGEQKIDESTFDEADNSVEEFTLHGLQSLKGSKDQGDRDSNFDGEFTLFSSQHLRASISEDDEKSVTDVDSAPSTQPHKTTLRRGPSI